MDTAEVKSPVACLLGNEVHFHGDEASSLTQKMQRRPIIWGEDANVGVKGVWVSVFAEVVGAHQVF